MVAEPAKKDDAKGKKPEQKKVELVPVEKLIDVLHEQVVTTITEIPTHMDVYGGAKPKIEEILKESIKMEELLRNLPRKKPTGPGTKVKPNEEKINELTTAITNFTQYVQKMRREGEMFGNAFAEIKERKDKVDKAAALAQNMRTQIPTLKKVNAAVQAMLKDEQYGFVKEPLQNEFETALVYFLVEFISFTTIIYDTLRYAIQNEDDKKAAAATQKEVLTELKAIADACEKSVGNFRTKKESIVEHVKDAKELKELLEKEEKAEVEELKLLQQKAEPIIKKIKDEIKKLIESIKKQDKAFSAFGELETITVKELRELKEIPTRISTEVGKIKAAAEEKAQLQRTIPPSGTETFKAKAEQIRRLDAIIEASKKEIKAQLDAFRNGISMEKTMGRREVISLNTVVNSTQEIVTITNQIEDTLKDKLILFLQSEEGKKAFPGDRIHNATTAALGDINRLQTIIGEEQEERSMIGIVGRVMRDRAQKEEVVKQEIEGIKKDEAIFKDNGNLITNIPKFTDKLKAEVEQIEGAEQALVNALKTSKETANKIKMQVAEVQKTVAEVEALLPTKGFFANLLKRFRR